ncbi:MAG: hypothetical protein J7L54_07585 [Elusimicrobia bacterium]|nr:hypothetical protein [Elusimicrobiota bacterium]
MYVARYKKFKKEQERARKKIIAASRVVHPVVFLTTIAAVVASVYVIVWKVKFEFLDKSRPLFSMKLLDVGQGSSLLIKTPSGKTVLVDAGPPVPKNEKEAGDYCLTVGENVWKTVILKELKKEKIDKIDYMIITSPFPNYCGGLKEIFADGFPVGKFYASDEYFPGPRFILFRNLREQAKKSGLFVKISAGDLILNEDVAIQALSPIMDYSGFEEFPKNASVILRVVYGNVAFVYGSNAGNAALNHVTSYDGLRSDVLIAPNYSSADSFSLTFLRKVSPKFCLISAGIGNKEDLPDSKILAFYDREKIKYFTTSSNGTISVFSDGKIVKIKGEY